MQPYHHQTDAQLEYHNVPTLLSRHDETEDGQVVCYLYPERAEMETRTTTWICALEGSFVDLEDVR